MLASSVAVGGGFAMAGAAAAAGGDGGSGVTATLESGNVKPGGFVKINDSDWLADGGLMKLKTSDGSTLLTYCIDIKTEAQDNAVYQETGWASSSLATNSDKTAPGKINWILQNSYPKVSDLAVLAKEAGAGSLTEDQAAAATQAAIWHFSDHVKAVPKDEDAAKLTDYLESHAVSVDEPAPSLTLTPPAVSGKSGALLGPIGVSTTGTSVAASLDATSSAAGVVLTDKNGTVLSDKNGKLTAPAKNGDSFFVKAPVGANAGTATISASTSAQVQAGRAFTSPGSQTLILAGAQTVTATANAKASWVPNGPAPAISAALVCQQNSVVVTITNSGDQDFKTTVSEKSFTKPVTVKPGATETVAVPEAQGAQYSITVTPGQNGKSQTFTGTVDCHVATSGGGTGGTTPTPSASPSPSSSPSHPASSAPATPAAGNTTGGGSLASTGGGGATPLIAGIAGALVLVGAGAVYTMRRRGRHGRTAA
ncbi:thioester domain-containing protein [Kitasatospora azatica]|uniref:thioester domain-containing protein n=1 Tax=Kitasatospora azatica TaxID=58347 RepID=UPI00056D3CD9|nr:thioester domain-containing protein [Kitasatospora azatica]